MHFYNIFFSDKKEKLFGGGAFKDTLSEMQKTREDFMKNTKPDRLNMFKPVFTSSHETNIEPPKNASPLSTPPVPIRPVIVLNIPDFLEFMKFPKILEFLKNLSLKGNS